MTDMREKVELAIAEAFYEGGGYEGMAQAAITALWPLFVERAAMAAEHLNGWGSDSGQGGHAMHIAATLRDLEPPQ